MAADFTVVDVWLGSFETESILTAYLAETYSDDDDETPISRFAADQHQRFYDHDFIERGFFAETTDLRSAFGRCSFASSWMEEVVSAYEASGIPPANTVLLSFASAIRSPRSASGAQYRLTHLGRFRSDPST